MKTKEAIELAGNAAGLAEMLDITASAISQWGDEVPTARIWQLKVLRPEWFANRALWNGIKRRTSPADRRDIKTA